MNENYDFADLAGKYYAMIMKKDNELKKVESKYLKIIRDLFTLSNSYIKNPPIDGRLYRCPVCKENWVHKPNEKSGYAPLYYWDRVCKRCFDEFLKMDTLSMIEVFQM